SRTIGDAAAVVIPPFIRADPALWFFMPESTFALAAPKAITEAKTKYNYVVAHLPLDTATIVRDVIMQPDVTDPYMDLISKIIERCGESKTEEIRRLLAGENLGDRKPSELLRDMKRRAENHKIEDELLFELFIQAMPLPVQTIIASISPLSTEKVAEVADRILAISNPLHFPHSIHPRVQHALNKNRF
ncbi:uncharacterized protein, partial [Parasteatoda tepidariorum]|uniref:uncharacterized protein n=1 Tax=Parasteatoda tepidariorum TaxID=114398 RepID=UPI0039BC4009